MAGESGGGGQGDKGPLRRWFHKVDRSVDDELNRFFSPDERSRTGEAMDKYAQRIETSLQRATKVAKKTKVDLDSLGDETIARLFGKGPKRERSDEANIGWITKRPKTILFAVLVVVMIVAFPALHITGNERLGIESSMRGDFEVFLPPKDETTEILNEVREYWSTDAMFIYGEMLSRDQNVSDYTVLKALSAIEGDDDHPPPPTPPEGSGYQSDLEWDLYGIDPWRDDQGEADGVKAVLSLPMLVKVVNETVTKVANQMGADQIQGNYSVPSDQALIDRIVGQLPPDISRSMVVDTNEDGVWDHFAIIVLLTKDPKIQLQVMAATEAIIARVNVEWEGTMALYLTGPTPLIQTIQERTIEEFFRVMPLVIMGLVLALYLFHRTLKVIPIALLPVFLGLLMALGIVGALHDYVAITPQVVIIAPVLLALGVSYGLYISNRFAEETEGEIEQRVARAVKAINPAIMLSALTTGIGFASLMIGTLPPIFAMGLALTIGIMFTYILTYILVPCLIVTLKYRKKAETRGMKAFSTVPSRNRKKIILIALIAAVVSTALIPAVRLDADYLAMAPEDETTVIKMDEYSRYMGGGQLGMFIVRRDPHQYETLDAMEEMTEDVNDVPNTQGISVVDIMKSIAVPEQVEVAGTMWDVPEGAQKSLWDAVVFFAELPGGSGDGVSQRLIDEFYRNLPDEVREMLITTEGEKALVYTFMPFMDIDDTRVAVEGVNGIVASYNAVHGDDFASKLTGIAAITLAVNDLIIVSQFNSLAVCIFLTFLTLTIIFRNVVIGAMTIIPVLCVIALEPGTLVGLNIPLSTITVMIGSIAIGTGVDFSIQISQRIRLGSYKLPAVFQTVERAGTSFVEATSTMLAGFAMVLFIPINSIQEFVIMIMILLSYNALFALLVLPSVYTIWIRRRDAREERMRKMGPIKTRRRAFSRDGYERFITRMFRLRGGEASRSSQTTLDTLEEPKKP